MLEMTEAANILNNATAQSLVLMDEIGRGTSTYDGLSLAWACAHAHRPQHVRAFTLFATHYFELTSLAGELEGCANVHLDATEHGDKLIFLHTVKEGPANQSYGLQVAALAGVPPKVITSARRYLHELERRSAEAHEPRPQQELLLEFRRMRREHEVVSALRELDPGCDDAERSARCVVRVEEEDMTLAKIAKIAKRRIGYCSIRGLGDLGERTSVLQEMPRPAPRLRPRTASRCATSATTM